MDSTKIGILAGLIIIVAIVLGVANMEPPKEEKQLPTEVETAVADESTTANAGETKNPSDAPSGEGIPRLVDVGAETCLPCKMMVPVLAELKKEYAGKLIVDVIDVRKNPDAGKEYRIQVIPTQIFYDSSGKELFRHRGFISKEDILAKWQELGFDFH